MTAPAAARLGCVLAGGRSTRMGRDKATLLFGGRALVEHAVDRLRSIGCQVSISASRPDLEAYAPVLPDLHPGRGPLGGIEAALSAAPAGTGVLFLPVDLPLLPASFLTLLFERAERTGALATIPVSGGRSHQLCAIYHADLLPRIQAALEAGEYRVMRVFESITQVWERDFVEVEAALSARSDLLDCEPEPLYRWFANLNTPEDLAALNSSIRLRTIGILSKARHLN